MPDRPPPAALPALLAAALSARQPLLARLHAEDTDCYRLFHGSVEGEPGLTVDRYGDMLLVQTFHRSLDAARLADLQVFYETALPGLAVVYNDRSRPHSRICNRLEGAALEAAMLPRIAHEMGVKFHIQGRHAGQDPWLFLDLRAARRRIRQEAPGKSLLNVFAYACGVGIGAAKAGASFVVNVDFAESSLAIGRENARLNELRREGNARPRFIQCDAFAALRQFSGLGQPKMVRGRRMPPFPEIEPRKFDIVFMDPPRYARSPFGVVDLVHDYPALFKPALLCVAEGGMLICTNNVAEVKREQWIDQLQRSAKKAGREIREVEIIPPEEDFPSSDGNPPLKIALLRV